MHWKEVLRSGKQAPYCVLGGQRLPVVAFKRPDKRAYDPFPCHSESKQVTYLNVSLTELVWLRCRYIGYVLYLRDY